MVRSTQSLESEWTQRTPKSRAQWERGKPVMPGGVIKGAYWTSPHPIYIDRADGCRLWDIDGREYVDFANHHTATILGHNHPDVIEAIRQESERGLALSGPTTLEAEVAEEIVARVPSVEKVRYSNSATESSQHTTRMVRALTGRPKVAKFEGAYHGSHDALEYSASPALDAAGPDDSPNPVPSHEGMTPDGGDHIVILPYNQPETVELILREQKDEIAAVYYDGRPSMMDIPAEFGHFVRDITRELGMYMVMDETVSFMAGPGGYQKEIGIEPDLTFFGKIMGGGFPGGVIGGKAEVMDILDNTAGARVFQSGTFSGNNFTLAAARATLRALTPEVYAHIDGLRQRLHTGLEAAYDKTGVPRHVMSAGTMVNAFPTDHPVRDYRSLATIDNDLYGRILTSLTLKGQYMGRGSMSIVLSAPMQNEEIDGLLEAFGEVLAEAD